MSLIQSIITAFYWNKIKISRLRSQSVFSRNHIQPQSIAIIENPSPSQRGSAVVHTRAHITGIANINIGMSLGPGGAGGHQIMDKVSPNIFLFSLCHL